MKFTRVPEINRRDWNATVGITALALFTGDNRGRAKEFTARVSDLTVYVSTSGNDGWSGTFSTANSAHSDGPVASVHRALEIVRNRRKVAKSTSSAHIVLRGGTYELGQSIVLAPEDSGTAESPFVIAAYPGEEPIISGGITIQNWRVRSDGLWEADGPDAMDAVTINQLFVRGQRKDRPRVPEKNWYFMEGMVEQQELRDRAFRFAKGQLNSNWHALRDVEVVSFESWTTERQWVQSVDTENDTVYVQNSGPEFENFEIRQRFYVDNVREALKKPGQWYFDRSTKTILYKPDSGDTLDTFSAVVPVLRHLIAFQGFPERTAYVEHITIKGVSFQHSACAVSRVCLAQGNQSATQGWEAAIFGRGVRDIRILDCDISHGGEHAVRFMGASQRVIVQQCHMHDMGGGGVYLGLDCAIAEYYKQPAAIRLTAECVVDNNFIHDSGKLFPQACGIWIGHAGDNRISHNAIMNIYYSGVSIGWNWGTTLSPAVRNLVEFNRIYNLGNGVLSDAGGIYTLGVSPGTVLRNNWLSGLIPYYSPRRFNGLYLDEGSSYILAENNIVQKADGMGMVLHYGAKNRILNNVLEETYGIAVGRDTDSFGRRIPLSLIFEQNVVVVNGNNILPPYNHAGWRCNRNVYWSSNGTAPTIHGDSFKQWQATGQDTNSLEASPGLHTVDGTSRAKAGTAASQIGFHAIDMRNIGLYGPASWRALPDTIKPLPLADRTPWPVPSAQPVHTTFRQEKSGEYPYNATTSGNGNSIAAPTEITGQKSLRFGPHAVAYTYYQPWLQRCNLLLKFSILIPKHIGTTLRAELRDYWHNNPYSTGPSIVFRGDGSVVANGVPAWTIGQQAYHPQGLNEDIFANGVPVGTVPLDKWVDVRVHYDYEDETSHRQYKISLSLAGKELASKQLLIPGAAGFRNLTWLGFINEGKIGQECYIGYLDCGPVVAGP